MCSSCLLDVEDGPEDVLLEVCAPVAGLALVPVCWFGEVWLALWDCVEDDVELELPHPVTVSPTTSTPPIIIASSRPIAMTS